jgi:peroxiredoxin Q/BCP
MTRLTAEACHFRDVASEFRAFGAQPVGISGDSVARQAEFSARYAFGYPLLSDPDGSIRDRFGIKRGSPLASGRRVTFVIDTDRRILEVIRSEIRMNVHADKALAALKART